MASKLQDNTASRTKKIGENPKGIFNSEVLMRRVENKQQSREKGGKIIFGTRHKEEQETESEKGFQV